MNKLDFATSISPKHSARLQYLKKHMKGSGGLFKKLTDSEMAQRDQRGEGARPRHALKFKM
jgi:hypothetical protein